MLSKQLDPNEARALVIIQTSGKLVSYASSVLYHQSCPPLWKHVPSRMLFPTAKYGFSQYSSIPTGIAAPVLGLRLQ
jgi:hypothetical protein